MSDVNYREILDKILNGYGIYIDYNQYEYIIRKLEKINKTVRMANDNKEDHGLRSTQVISYIIYDAFLELGLDLLL